MRSLFFAVGLLASANAQILDGNFNTVAELWLKALHVPGMSVAVVKNGKVESKGYGFSKLGPAIPATADTLYFTGSTTKAFTAAAAAKILANSSKKLQWSTPMAELLPGDFVLSDEYASSHITLEDALSHRSGMARHDGAYGWEKNATTTDLMRELRYLPASAEPRTNWMYNNYMFAAVGLFVENFTKRTLEDVLDEWFWKPLGMTSTTFNISEASKLKDVAENERLARGYFWTGDHYVPDAYIDLIPVAGAGATISSVNDYTLWAKAILDAAKQRPNSSSPVDTATYIELTTPRSIIPLTLPPEYHLLEVPTYALGWIIQKIGRHTTISHSGGLLGFGTELFIVPSLDLAFVTMGNTMQTSNTLGTVLFIEVMRKLGELSVEEEEAAMEVLKLQSVPASGTAKQPERLNVYQKPPRPAPPTGELGEYLGEYTHPAYGVFNVSVGTAKPITTEKTQQPLGADPLILHVTPSKRTWPHLYVLTHSHHTFFDVGTLFVHGATDLPTCSAQLQCKNELGYELMATSRAVFEIGPSGKVENLGIELEPDMVRYAVEENLDWREGIIWFVKI